jgi:sugar phosphate isomerase/epimerase
MPPLVGVKRSTTPVRFPIAVPTDALADMSLGDVLDWCAARDVAGVELGVGGYSPAPHISREEMISSAFSRHGLQDSPDRAGLELVALNASGNPLHPVVRR